VAARHWRPQTSRDTGLELAADDGAGFDLRRVAPSGAAVLAGVRIGRQRRLDIVSTVADTACRALVLLDRPLVADLLRSTFDHGAFDVRGAGNLAETVALLAEWRPDIAVVDMDHDDSTALLDLLGESSGLRRTGTPVLGLTRRADLDTKLRAFGLGVDDILTMPCAPEELLARAIVLTRRVAGIHMRLIPSITIGEIRIDIFNRIVTAGDSVVRLSGIEQSLLYLLASREGRVVTRKEIRDAIWGADFVGESNIVDRHIRSLRIKLQDDYRHPRFIATVPGEGYQFIPTVSTADWSGGPTASEHTHH
jgi:two-component system alkaline phosphatase synthesis response regulator PhoP